MKAEKMVTVKYVYAHNNDTFQIDESLKDVLHSLKCDREQDIYDWVDDDTWLTLPKNPFVVSKLKLDKNGSPTFIQFTERKTSV